MEISKLKNYWWLWVTIITIVGGAITFSAHLYAMWQTPQKQDEAWEKTNDQFQQFYEAQTNFLTTQQSYVAQNEERWRNQEKANERFYRWMNQ